MAESGGSNSRHLSQTGHNQLLLTATNKQTDTRQPDIREQRELSKIGPRIGPTKVQWYDFKYGMAHHGEHEVV